MTDGSGTQAPPTTLPPSGVPAGESTGILAWADGYPLLQAAGGLLLVLIAAWFVHVLLRRYAMALTARLTTRLPGRWPEALARHPLLERLVPLAPALVLYQGVVAIPHLPVAFEDFLQRLALATLAVLVARAIGALLDVLHEAYNLHPMSAGRPIKGYVQVVKLVLYLLAGFLVLAALSNQSPWFFVSGLGAMTAILMLIFRDTLLSLVAGVQLVNNDLVRVGDWIEMSQFDADGHVIDISLNVVRVQNWDRTITVIPTHKFLEHSFRNWRGMFDSGGRRISRTIHLDMSSVRFLTPPEIERFRRFLLLEEYITEKERELATWNAENCPPEGSDIVANMRHLTNLGTFRAYILQYLKRHPQIHQDQTIMVRQMAPGAEGVGLQVYAFTRDTRWVNYEGIQGDIFDHILAIAPEFGLRVYQAPGGYDIARLGEALHPERPDRSHARLHAVEASKGATPGTTA